MEGNGVEWNGCAMDLGFFFAFEMEFFSRERWLMLGVRNDLVWPPLFSGGGGNACMIYCSCFMYGNNHM